jgi:uncharacterized protein YceK
MDIPLLPHSWLTSNYKCWCTNFWLWSRYIVLAWTVCRTPFPTVPLLLYVYLLPQKCVLSHCCLVAVHSCSTILASNHHTHNMYINLYHEYTKWHFTNTSQSSFIVPIIQMPRSELFILENECYYKACTALHHILHNKHAIIIFCVQNLGVRIL